MPFPHISGALNNCSLHALTPEIIAEIQRLSENHEDTNDYTLTYVCY